MADHKHKHGVRKGWSFSKNYITKNEAKHGKDPQQLLGARPKRVIAGGFVAAMLLPAIAMPAYAAVNLDEDNLETIATEVDLLEASSEQLKAANSQKLTTANYDEESELVTLGEVEAEVSSEWLAEQERIKAEEAAAAEKEAEEARIAAEAEKKQEQPAPGSGGDIVASQNAQGVADAALAQLGIAQDCTDLVQNSLAAAGYTTRRDQGGFDRGTGVWDWEGFGSRVSLDSLAPGDILIYGNAGSGAHVAIYVGNGQAVHGGWNGSTVLAGIQAHLPLTAAVRPA